MQLTSLGLRGSTNFELISKSIKNMSESMAVATVNGTALDEIGKKQVLVAAGFCDTEEEAAKILEVHANREQLLTNAQTQRATATNATATANAAATASETAKQTATDGITAANTAQAASETAKQASVDGTTAANAAETASETAKTTSGLEGFAANVSEAGSEATKQAAVDGTTVANAAETLSEEAKNASGTEGVATNIAEAASEATETAATNASAVANAAEAITEQAKAVAGAEGTVVNDAQAVSEGAAANATRDHAAANLAETASEKAKQGVQKKGILVTSKLGTALKGLLTNKYTWIVAGIAAVTAGIVALYKHFNPSKETLGKNLDEAKQKVQESTQKIEEMENELTNVRDRIAELKGMGSLTIVQQKELDNLEKSGAQLERNIELEKEYRRLKKKDANKDFVDWFNKDMKDGNEFVYFDNDVSSGSSSRWAKVLKFIYEWRQGIDEGSGMREASAYVLSGQDPTTSLPDSDEDKNLELWKNKAKELIKSKNLKNTTREAQKEIDSQLEEIEKHFLDKTKELEETLGDKEAELTWTPNAVAGTDEAEVNDIIVYMDELRDQAMLLKGEIHNDIAGAYDSIVNANLKSDRFSEAAKEIEKLKTAEDGTSKSAKKFRKDLYDLLKTAKDGSNIKQLADYLAELGMIDITQGEKGITDLSEAIIQTTTETEKATQSNLLFADSYSKITEARKAFEEGLQNVETGTEDFESYADSYEQAMELLNKGFDLDNGVLMAHVERLISDDQLRELGYDADKVKEYLQKHLKGVFGDKDTDSPGKGLVNKIKNGVDKDGKIYGKADKNGVRRELASYDGKTWTFSDKEEDIEALGKKFNMTSDQILACVKALNTYNEIELNNTDTIVDKLKKEGKVYTVTTKEADENGKKKNKKKKSAVNVSQLEADMESSGQYTQKEIFDTIQQLKNDDNVITVEIDAKTKNKQVAEELEKLGILSGVKTEKDENGNERKYRQVDNIDQATSALKKFGLTGQEAYDKLKKISIGGKDGKLLSDAKKIESVIKTFSSDFNLNDYKHLNTDSEERFEVVNVVPLKEELKNKGYSERFINDYIKSLQDQNNVVNIDVSMEFTQEGDVQTVEDQLVKAGVATKGEDGKYEIDVKQTVTLLKNTGSDSDDITTFLQNLQNADKNGTINFSFSSNISSIEGEVQNVFSGVSELGNQIDETNQGLSRLDQATLGNVTQQMQAFYGEAANSRDEVNNLYDQLVTLSSGEYKAKIKVVTDSANDGRPTTTGAQASGTAYAGGNWGTAPGGKTLTGELG